MPVFVHGSTFHQVHSFIVFVLYARYPGCRMTFHTKKQNMHKPVSTTYTISPASCYIESATEMHTCCSPPYVVAV